MTKIKWGIVGPGKIAKQFAADFEYVTKGELTAVGSRSLDSAKAFASDYNIPNAYGSYEEVYQSPDVDAIYIATPHAFHFEMASAALKAGKHVLCEKPITVNLAECNQLVEIAKNSGKYLMEGMWTYFLPTIQKVKQWIDEGSIGKVKHIKADFGFVAPFNPEGRLFDPKLGGGSLLDIGIYPIALTWLIYQKPASNMTVIAKKASTGVDSDVTLLFEYDDALASLQSSITMMLQNSAYIIGEQGYIEIQNFWKTKKAILHLANGSTEVFEDDRSSNGFNFETDAVNEDILAGKTQSDIVPWSTSLQLQETMMAVMSKF